MRQHRRNAGGFKALEWGDTIALIDHPDGDVALFDVAWDGGITLMGCDTGDGTGLITIWAVTAPPPPYLLDSKGAQGVIAPGAFAAATPNSLVLGKTELVQARFKMRLIDTAGVSGAKIDDFTLGAFLPGSSAIWGTSTSRGVLRATQQIGDPADAVSAPLQGSNQLAPTAPAAVRDGWAEADTTEIFWFHDQVPRFQLNYFGSAATPAGIALALEVQAYRYILTPRDPGSRVVTLGGRAIGLPEGLMPEDIIGIPVAGRSV